MATLSNAPRTQTITLSSDSAGPFNIDFRVFSETQFLVYVDGVSSTDWTVSATFVDGYSDTATITFDSALTTGTEVLILSWLEATRDEDLVPGPDLVDNLNLDLGRMTAMIADIRSRYEPDQVQTAIDAAAAASASAAAAADSAEEAALFDPDTYAAKAGSATITGTWDFSGGGLVYPADSVTDWNNVVDNGFYYAPAGSTNAPVDLAASALCGFVSKQGDNDLVQVVFGQSITRMYWRLRNAGTWSSWERSMRFSDVLDEDDFASLDKDKPPSQQSVAAYVGLAKISETTISSDATIDLTLDTATYRSFMIKISNVVPETDTVDLLMRTSSDAGSTFDSGASDYANVATGQSPTTDEAVYLTLTSDIGSAAGEDGLSGIITIHDPGDATTKTKATYNVTFINSGGNLTSRTGGGMRATAEANDAIRFLMSSGNLESGKITLFGVK